MSGAVREAGRFLGIAPSHLRDPGRISCWRISSIEVGHFQKQEVQRPHRSRCRFLHLKPQEANAARTKRAESWRSY
jgi:hypothetical protein